ALGFHHRRAGVVFRGDQLDVLFLALGFLLHCGKEFGVKTSEGQITAEHGGPLKSAGRLKEGADSTAKVAFRHMKVGHGPDKMPSCKVEPSWPRPRRDQVHA